MKLTKDSVGKVYKCNSDYIHTIVDERHGYLISEYSCPMDTDYKDDVGVCVINSNGFFGTGGHLVSLYVKPRTLEEVAGDMASTIKFISGEVQRNIHSDAYKAIGVVNFKHFDTLLKEYEAVKGGV